MCNLLLFDPISLRPSFLLIKPVLSLVNTYIQLKLFHHFWQGHEGKFSVYVHASKEKPVHVSRYFVNRDIRSDQVHKFNFKVYSWFMFLHGYTLKWVFFQKKTMIKLFAALIIQFIFLFFYFLNQHFCFWQILTPSVKNRNYCSIRKRQLHLLKKWA